MPNFLTLSIIKRMNISEVMKEILRKVADHKHIEKDENGACIECADTIYEAIKAEIY